MTRNYIVAEIQRMVAKTGQVPGKEAFRRETGVRETDWSGKYWVRWSDALREAGFKPRQMQVAFSEEYLLEKLVGLTRELGHFPVSAEVRLKAHDDPEFPSHNTFARLGAKRQLALKLTQYCEAHAGNEDVASLCRPIASSETGARDEVRSQEICIGFVYLLRSGRYYKIGRSNAAGRRERELAIQLPEKAETLHVIRTDDPPGIEAYWHTRFAEKRKNGEWFALTHADVHAFRRRKFM